MSDEIYKALRLFLFGLILGMLITGFILLVVKPVAEGRPNIDLPEEYKLITPNDKLQGNYDKTTNTLHIWFNNPQNN